MISCSHEVSCLNSKQHLHFGSRPKISTALLPVDKQCLSSDFMKKKHPQNGVREMRKRKNFTQKQLADSIGLSAPAITQIENLESALTIPVAKRIADALGCHFLDVVNGPVADDQLAKNEQERQLLANFRAMQDREQQLYLAMGDAFSKDQAGDNAKPPKKTGAKK